jgi:hypothetical protein
MLVRAVGRCGQDLWSAVVSGRRRVSCCCYSVENDCGQPLHSREQCSFWTLDLQGGHKCAQPPVPHQPTWSRGADTSRGLPKQKPWQVVPKDSLHMSALAIARPRQARGAVQPHHTTSMSPKKQQRGPGALTGAELAERSCSAMSGCVMRCTAVRLREPTTGPPRASCSFCRKRASAMSATADAAVARATVAWPPRERPFATATAAGLKMPDASAPRVPGVSGASNPDHAAPWRPHAAPWRAPPQ